MRQTTVGYPDTEEFEPPKLPTQCQIDAIKAILGARIPTCVGNPYPSRGDRTGNGGLTGPSLIIAIIILHFIDRSPLIKKVIELGANDALFSFILGLLSPPQHTNSTNSIFAIESIDGRSRVSSNWLRLCRRLHVKLNIVPQIINASYTAANLWILKQPLLQGEPLGFFLNNARGCTKGDTEDKLYNNILKRCAVGSFIVTFDTIILGEHSSWVEEKIIIADLPRRELPYSTYFGCPLDTRDFTIFKYTKIDPPSATSAQQRSSQRRNTAPSRVIKFSDKLLPGYYKDNQKNQVNN